MRYSPIASGAFKRVVKKLRRNSPNLLKELDRGIEKVLREPTFGKPLRYSLKNYRRIHIGGSFVLVYEILRTEISLIDFDHHDRIYKKYS